MKKTLFLFMISFSSFVFSQDKAKVVSKYKNTAQIGNFLTRWYYDLVGSSLAWKESLTLYADSTYRYVYQGGECGSFDEDSRGTWSISATMLKLKSSSSSDRSYQLIDGKLYWPEAMNFTKEHVVMK